MTPLRLAMLALAALLATGGAFWLSSQRHLERAVTAGDPVLPPLRAAIEDAAEIRLRRGDGAVVTLRLGERGWVVAERGWPADAGKLRKFLLDLAALEIVEEKTHDPARYPVLGVEDVAGPAASGTQVEVKTRKGSIQSLILGKPSGSREVFVRTVGAAASYLARPAPSVEASPARWLDKRMVDVDAARIRSVSLQRPGAAPLVLEGAGLPAGLAAALDGLELDDVRTRALEDRVAGTAAAGPAAGGPGAHRSRFTTWEGLSVEVEGREEGPRRWIRLAASFDPATARARPAPPAAAEASPAAPAPDGAAEAAALARLAADREFEVPVYRFDSLFQADTGVPSAADPR